VLIAGNGQGLQEAGFGAAQVRSLRQQISVHT